MNAAWREVVSGRNAKLLTVILLIVQLAGCAVDLTSRQVVLMSGFCMVTHNEALAIATTGIGFVLVFSWIVGLISLRIATLRPVYWVLVLLIPVGFVVQRQLLHHQILDCDAL